MLVRSPRRRRTLVAACLPYLLLSVLVDFVHLHPLMVGGAPRVSASEPATAPGTHQTPTSPRCAVCLWMQAGTGIQPSVSNGPTVVALASAVTPVETPSPSRSTFLSPDLRGPPIAQFS